MTTRTFRSRFDRPAFRLGPALVLVIVACAGSPSTAPLPPPPSVVGFSFSPKVAAQLGEDPARALASLLRALQPDVIRLPVYWDEVERARGAFDFAPTDRMLAVLAAYDRADPADHHVRALLVVGARNLANPELHAPPWALPPGGRLADVARSSAYEEYLARSLQHFARAPLLFGWQLENEPLDNTNPLIGDVSLTAGDVAGEITELRAIDPTHPIVVTTYDSATVALDQNHNGRLSWLWDNLPGPHGVGHPLPTLDLGDALGLDAYVVTPSTPLSEADAATRIEWKTEALRYWSRQARARGKQLWITEMQAAPWYGTTGFTIPDLLESARAYRGSGASMVLLWGVEAWVGAPSWMMAGRQAADLLQGA